MGINELATNIVIDKDGKITLPKIVMDYLHWGPGSLLELCVQDGYSGGVHLWTEVPQCSFCYEIEGPFYNYIASGRKLLICKGCQADIEGLRHKLKDYLEVGAEQE